MLDELAERLARDIDAGEQHQAGRGPGRDAAVEMEKIGVAGAQKNRRRALDQAVGVVAQHDAGAAARHQTGEIELQPAQRHRAREQEMALREDQLLAQVDERQLPPVAEHGPEGVRVQRPQRGARRHCRGSFGQKAHVACCGVIWCTLPDARSKRTRWMLSRLVPVTRMKRA